VTLRATIHNLNDVNASELLLGTVVKLLGETEGYDRIRLSEPDSTPPGGVEISVIPLHVKGSLARVASDEADSLLEADRKRTEESILDYLATHTLVGAPFGDIANAITDIYGFNRIRFIPDILDDLLSRGRVYLIDNQADSDDTWHLVDQTPAEVTIDVERPTGGPVTGEVVGDTVEGGEYFRPSDCLPGLESALEEFERHTNGVSADPEPGPSSPAPGSPDVPDEADEASSAADGSEAPTPPAASDPSPTIPPPAAHVADGPTTPDVEPAEVEENAGDAPAPDGPVPGDDSGVHAAPGTGGDVVPTELSLVDLVVAYLREQPARQSAIGLHLDRLNVEWNTPVLVAALDELRNAGRATFNGEAWALVDDESGFACRECGCTDDHACEGGCSWVAAELNNPAGPLCTACGTPSPLAQEVTDEIDEAFAEEPSTVRKFMTDEELLDHLERLQPIGCTDLHAAIGYPASRSALGLRLSKFAKDGRAVSLDRKWRSLRNVTAPTPVTVPPALADEQPEPPERLELEDEQILKMTLEMADPKTGVLVNTVHKALPWVLRSRFEAHDVAAVMSRLVSSGALTKRRGAYFDPDDVR
jgi:hypothetical protein